MATHGDETLIERYQRETEADARLADRIASLPANLRAEADRIGADNWQVSGLLYNAASEIEASRLELTRLRAALEAIVKHQTLAAGSLAEYSGTLRIAKDALGLTHNT